MEIKTKKLPQSRIQLTVTVSGSVFAEHYPAALKKISQNVEIKGFRKGHAPEKMVLAKVGPSALLNELLDRVVPESYYQAIRQQKDLVPVAQPKINVTELKGLDTSATIPTEMTFTADVDVMPDFTLPDYKKMKIKAKPATLTVEAKEVDGTIEELKRVYGDDYLAKANFKNEAEMRTAVEENIRQQKQFQNTADNYDLIIEELIKKTKIEVPESFIHNEIHRMENQVAMQAKAYGMTFDDWLKKEKKTHDDIHTEWRPQGEKAAKAGMILGKIAEAEGIDPNKADASRLVLEKLASYCLK